MNWFLRRVVVWWVRFRVRPDNAAALLRGRRHPVCYVLEQRSGIDLAVLQQACQELQLPRPAAPLGGGTSGLRSYAFLVRQRGPGGVRRPPPHLAQMIRVLREDPAADFDLVPAAVYWGRAPQRESSWLRLLLDDDWAITSRLRKFLQVIFNGRNTLLELDEPVSLRELLGASLAVATRGRRVVRSLRELYRRRRAARIGPDLSHRRTLVNGVLNTRAVRRAVAQEMRNAQLPRRKALLRARGYALEIAANYSHVFVRFLASVFARLWNRLYDGVEFGNAATLEQVAEGNEIIYVPCHRSHMDYLLLSYAVYVHGFAVAHIAAGVNLDLPVIGRLLRKGGAFFIRRSFRGNALYGAVLTNYLAAIMARGHPIEYFIEGGRSRTGRLLQPKTGMLSMTVRSFLQEPVRPVVFVPVYFGYERLVEGGTYVGELSGRPKEKESVLGLLRSWRVLRERFGKVYVNLGEPIALAQVLDRHNGQWRTQRFGESTPAPWVGGAVEELAGTIMRNINAAAVVTPVNLLALALLAMPRQALPEADLVRQLELYRTLLGQFPYSDRVSVTALSGAQMIDYGIELKMISREVQPLGDIVRMSEASAVLATYFRNNILHLFALPSLLACAFGSNAAIPRADLQRLAGRIYPYVAAELFLRWPESEVAQAVDRALAAMGDLGLLEADPAVQGWRRAPPASAQAMQLSLLAQPTLQTIERYYMAVAQLVSAGSGAISQATLEKRCQLTAQRMTQLYGLNSPEFFDPALFGNFIGLLRRRGVIRASAAGELEFDEVLLRVAQDAQLVLSEQLRHSILQVMHA
ncbi:MAG: glycerol-3-phosphate 1-O-acyltransferase PlsB [Proteobacteria bacterium]|nr:glycerol-3-phosphate 1-O-acyltransferase PlsB [Pseudomonadota bacterium]